MPRQPRTILVLGGIRSGKSAFATVLVDDATTVRHIATAAQQAPNDAQPVVESLSQPEDLAPLIAEAGPDEVLVVDDIGGWLATLLARGTAGTARTSPGVTAMDVAAATEALAAAIAATAARVVLVSPEVGLAPRPAKAADRAYVDACGSINRALATACDGVVFLVAGQPTWLKATAGRELVNVVVAAPERAARDTVSVVEAEIGAVEGESPITIGMTLPLPDTAASEAATKRAEALPVPGPGFGTLTPAIAFVAGVQGTAAPVPLRSARVIAIQGSYTGGLAAGESAADAATRLAATKAGESALARMAADAGASVEILDAGEALAAEDGPVATGEEIERAMRAGYATAQRAADRGDDLIVIAAAGAGTSAAAAALVAALTRAEVPSLLGRVWRPDGTVDDEAWMRRCVTIRDALRAAKGAIMDAPAALATVGGPALAAATGVVLGAAIRRTPVLIDGPVGAAAALAARDYASQTRLWCLVAAVTGEPAAALAADRLGLQPLVDLGIGVGEGTSALAVLPILQSALAISAALGPQV